jgi:hypothetical protein
MKKIIYSLTLAFILLIPVKASCGIRLKAASLLATPIISEVKNYKQQKSALKEYKKAVYNLTVGDISFIERIDNQRIQNLVEGVFAIGIRDGQKKIIKTIFEDKTEATKMFSCALNIKNEDIKQDVIKELHNQKISENEKYITVFMIKTFEKCTQSKFMEDELATIKREIDYAIEKDLRE